MTQMQCNTTLYPFQNVEDSTDPEESTIVAKLGQFSDFAYVGLTFRTSYMMTAEVDIHCPSQPKDEGYGTIHRFTARDLAVMLRDALNEAIAEADTKSEEKREANQEKFDKLIATGPEGIDEICSC